MFRSTLYKDKGHHICTVYFKSVLSQSLAKRELGKKAFCIPTLLSAGPALLLVAWAERKRVFHGYGFGPEQGRSRMNTMHTHLTPTHLPLQTGKGLPYLLYHWRPRGDGHALLPWAVADIYLPKQWPEWGWIHGSEESSPTYVWGQLKNRALHMVPHSTNLREQKHVPLGSDLDTTDPEL